MSTPSALPDLLHRTAFNLCAALAEAKGRVHLVAGNPLYAAELSERLGRGEGRERSRRPPVLVWADPRPEAWPQVADRLQEFPPGGTVLVLAAGWTGRKWARRLIGEREDRYLRPATIARWLVGNGFRVTARYGIGGPAYCFWGALARAAALLRRDDWADRLHARAREALLSEDGPVETARLVILVARKPEER